MCHVRLRRSARCGSGRPRRLARSLVGIRRSRHDRERAVPLQLSSQAPRSRRPRHHRPARGRGFVSLRRSWTGGRGTCASLRRRATPRAATRPAGSHDRPHRAGTVIRCSATPLAFPCTLRAATRAQRRWGRTSSPQRARPSSTDCSDRAVHRAPGRGGCRAPRSGRSWSTIVGGTALGVESHGRAADEQQIGAGRARGEQHAARSVVERRPSRSGPMMDPIHPSPRRAARSMAASLWPPISTGIRAARPRVRVDGGERRERPVEGRPCRPRRSTACAGWRCARRTAHPGGPTACPSPPPPPPANRRPTP